MSNLHIDLSVLQGIERNRQGFQIPGASSLFKPMLSKTVVLKDGFLLDGFANQR